MRGIWLLGIALVAHAGFAAAESPAPPRRGRVAVAARARKPSRSLATYESDYASAPSYRYGNLDAPGCLAELAARGVVHTRVDEAPGVLAPVRLPEGVGGVRYHTAVPAAARATNPHDVFDCRLVLALDDFSKLLLRHGIDDVVMFSVWRPPAKRWPKDKLAHRHPGALAIDVKTLRSTKLEGATPPLEVLDHYRGAIGEPSCGPNAQSPSPPSDEATRLRAIVCEAVEARLFTSVLTPNHDRAHANHLHLEVTPGVPWRLVR